MHAADKAAHRHGAPAGQGHGLDRLARRDGHRGVEDVAGLLRLPWNAAVGAGIRVVEVWQGGDDVVLRIGGTQVVGQGDLEAARAAVGVMDGP